MSNLNQCTFTGRIGQEPDTSYTPNGTARASFSIAVSKHVKDDSGKFNETTTWVPVTAWSWLAEKVMKFGGKGVQVFVVGEYESRKYQDKEGNQRVYTGIRATFLEFGKGGKSSTSEEVGDLPEYDPETGERF